MNPDVRNPHDRFFKDTFSRPEVARSFSENHLPASIGQHLDLSVMELQKESFTDENLQQHFSDLLYRTKLRNQENGYIWLLFEHKSRSEPMTIYQLLRYMIQIWDRLLHQKPLTTLPCIIPIVIYQGRSKWSAPRSFEKLFNTPSDLHPYIPSFEYHLADLSHYEDHQIKGVVLLRVYIEIVKHFQRKDFSHRLVNILGLLHELSEKKTALEYLQVTLRYLVTIWGTDLCRGCP